MTSKAAIFALGGAALAGVLILARRDYNSWVATGPGGLPHSLRGWIAMTRLRIEVQLHGFDPREADAIEVRTNPTALGPFLEGLPKRRGDRPSIEPYPIPHRLGTHPASREIRQRLERAFEDFVAKRDERVVMTRSHFEKHNDAVTARSVRYDHGDALLSHGEIGHVHPSDGSMHLVMHPSDAATVIRAEWGELHPLSGMGILPGAYLMVYPPTQEEDLPVILRLLDAATDYVLG